MALGILALLVTVIGTLLTAQNVAREQEIGTIEQLIVTPLTKGQFIAGKLLPFWGLGLLEFAAGLTLIWLAFAVPLKGSLLLFAVAAIYLTVALSIGLWISTAVDTQQQAMFITFFVMVLYLFMSGLFTPIASMPTWAEWLAELNPLKHFVEIMRKVPMKGAGLLEVWQPMAILAGRPHATHPGHPRPLRPERDREVQSPRPRTTRSSNGRDIRKRRTRWLNRPPLLSFPHVSHGASFPCV